MYETFFPTDTVTRQNIPANETGQNVPKNDLENVQKIKNVSGNETLAGAEVVKEV